MSNILDLQLNNIRLIPEIAKVLLQAIDESAIIAVTDQFGTIVYINDQFCRISGYSYEELVGSNHRILKSGQHPPEFYKDLWTTIRSGQVWHGEICNKRKDGTLYWVDSVLYPIMSQDNKPEHFVAIRRDISRFKHQQIQLENERQAALKQNRVAHVGQMASEILHEINNPLLVILGHAENALIDLQKNPETIQGHLEKILKHGHLLSQIIKGIKSLVREGSQDPVEKFSLSQILEDSLEICRERLKRKAIQITIVGEKDVHLPCRQIQIVQCLVNLINNSSDAIQDLPEKWIEIKVQKQEAYCEIAVTDSGSGLSEIAQLHLFEAFFTTKKAEFGSGLGLGLVKQICESHYGRIKYDKKSKNTRFCLHLPWDQKKPLPNLDYELARIKFMQWRDKILQLKEKTIPYLSLEEMKDPSQIGDWLRANQSWLGHLPSSLEALKALNGLQQTVDKLIDLASKPHPTPAEQGQLSNYVSAFSGLSIEFIAEMDRIFKELP